MRDVCSRLQAAREGLRSPSAPAAQDPQSNTLGIFLCPLTPACARYIQDTCSIFPARPRRGRERSGRARQWTEQQEREALPYRPVSQSDPDVSSPHTAEPPLIPSVEGGKITKAQRGKNQEEDWKRPRIGNGRGLETAADWKGRRAPLSREPF